MPKGASTINDFGGGGFLLKDHVRLFTIFRHGKTVTSGGPGTWIKCDQTIQICTSLNGINCPYNVLYSATIMSRTDRNKFGNNIHSHERKQAAKNNWYVPPPKLF